MKSRLLILLLLIGNPILAIGNMEHINSDSIDNKRLTWVLAGGGATYALGMAGLSATWYSDQSTRSFHFFDDLAQWKQMDKLGHIYSAYHISFAAAGTFRWAGMDNRKAAIWGAATSGIMMLPVEVLDGFSEDYGFSWSDLAANSLGAGIFLAQELAWGEARIQPKLSFQRTGYASQRPGTLGDGLHEEWLKDYNGQTYWFSANPYLLSNRKSILPKWLNISIGYGAADMIYGRDQENIAAGLDPYRRYFLSVDVDFRAFKGQNNFLNTLLDALNLIKIPAPTLEYNRKDGLKGYGLYF